MRRLLALGALLALAPAAGAHAQQAGDPPPAQQQTADASPVQQPQEDLPPGQRMLNVCRSCHTLDQGARTLIGPNLHGVFGRPAGAIEGYRYSVNMKKLATTGHVWSEQNLRSWLANPQAVVPRTAMKFPGVPDEQHLNELMPLLKQATGG